MKKKRSRFGLLVDVVMTAATGGLWLVWVFIRSAGGR